MANMATVRWVLSDKIANEDRAEVRAKLQRIPEQFFGIFLGKRQTTEWRQINVQIL